jgi:hypothetical protein
MLKYEALCLHVEGITLMNYGDIQNNESVIDIVIPVLPLNIVLPLNKKVEIEIFEEKEYEYPE